MSNKSIYLGHRFSGVNSMKGRGRQIVHSTHEQQQILSGSQTTGTMDNWYHAIFDIGGQLVPSSFSIVDNWDHAIFDMGGQLGPFPILLIYWYHLSLTGVG